MSTFALQSGLIPPPEAWVSSPAQFPTEEVQREYTANLKLLQEKYRLRNELCQYDFRGNNFTTDLLKQITDYSRTITKYLYDQPERGPLYYTYWEVYHTIFTKDFMLRIQARYDMIKSKAFGRKKERLEEIGVKIKGVPIRSFHIADDSADSGRAFARVINKIEAETGSTIAWNHLTTYTQDRSGADRIEHVKDAAHWIKGVDSDSCNLANIRAWKNKITTALKTVDIIVVNEVGDMADDDSSPTVCAIAFVLMNLNPDGYAIISLRDFSSAAAVSVIHLFACAFEKSNIIHTVASDRLFLCGSRFKNNVIAAQYKHLYTACITPTHSIFSPEYMNGPAFTQTVETLLNVIRAASNWREQQYRKLFSIYDELSNSLSGKIIKGHVEKVLEERYPDQSGRWRAAMEY